MNWSGRPAAACLLAIAACVAGCATRAPAGSGWLTGRLSVQVEATADAPAKRLSSGFELRGDADRGELRLTTPLGTQVAAAEWAPGMARLVTPDGTSLHADLDALSRQALGEALPLRALPDWLRGQPWAGAASSATADGFEQLGWQVGLARYAQGAVDARRNAAPAVTVRALLESPG